MLSRKASLEIGVNTIVILVIAMVLLGLGIGFVKGLFGKINKLPGAIDIPSIGKEPNSAEPIVLGQGSLTVKSGDIEQVSVGVYNSWDSTAPSSWVTIDITECTGNVKPKVDALAQQISKGESAGFLINVEATSGTPGTPIPEGTYVCNVGAFAGSSKPVATTGTPKATSQFTMSVTG